MSLFVSVVPHKFRDSLRLTLSPRHFPTGAAASNGELAGLSQVAYVERKEVPVDADVANAPKASGGMCVFVLCDVCCVLVCVCVCVYVCGCVCVSVC